MASLVTNGSATIALQTLRSINSALGETQNRVSSGLRVEKAANNAAYWSIATTMRSDNMALSAVSDSIGVGRAVLDVAYTGMSQILDYLSDAKNLIVLAESEGTATTNGTWYDYEPDEIYDGTPLGKIDRRLRGIFDDILTVVNNSSFSGINLLKNEKGGANIDTGTVEFVTGYANSSVLTSKLNLTSTVMVNYDRTDDVFEGEAGSENQGFLDGKINFVSWERLATYYSVGGDKVVTNGDYYILRNSLWNYNNSPNYSTRPLSDYYDVLLNEMEVKASKITQGMSVVGSLQKSMAMFSDFTTSRMDDITRGVGRLVDADMEEESSRLAALQSKQQLGIQSLSIANSTPKTILSLFQRFG